jgi:hypothetical protein
MDHLEAKKNIFFASCLENHSQIFNLDYYRSYSIVGISSSIIYWPFYYIYPDPYSHYFLGILTLLGFALASCKALKIKYFIALIPCLYFPLVFQVLHDTGPIRLAIISYPFIILLIFLFFNSKSSLYKILSCFGIFLIISIAIEDKAFFIFILPQIIFLGIGYYLIFEINKTGLEIIFNLRLYKLISILLMTICLALFFVLFCIRIPGQDDLSISYFKFLSSIYREPLGFRKELKEIIQYLLSPIWMSSRIYNFSWLSKGISCIFFLPALFLFLNVKGRLASFKYICFGSIFVTCIIFLISSITWSGHHFIFLHIPIIFLLMQYASKSYNNYLKTILCLSLSSLVAILQLNYADIGIHSRFDKSGLTYLLKDENLAKNSIINFSSWGGYYIQALYGNKSQLVTWTYPLNFQNAKEINELSIKTKRSLIFNICHSCTRDEILKFFPEKSVTRLTTKNSYWILWKIESKI